MRETLFSKIKKRQKEEKNQEEIKSKVAEVQFLLEDECKDIKMNLQSLSNSFNNSYQYKEYAKDLLNTAEQLDRPLLVMIMGEFKTGKSTFINTILEEEILKSDVTPATAVVTVLSYGKTKKAVAHLIDGSKKEFKYEELSSITAEGDEEKAELRKNIKFVEIFLPKEILKKINIIDTPGLNVDNKLHIEATKRFINEADYIYWVFSYGKAATSTELAEIKKLNKRLKPVAIVNRIDEIDEEEEELDDVLYEIKQRLGDNVKEVLGVSAYLAKKGVLEKNNHLIEESNWNSFKNSMKENVLDKSQELKSEAIKFKLEDLTNKLQENNKKMISENSNRKNRMNNSTKFKEDLILDRQKVFIFIEACKNIEENKKDYMVEYDTWIKVMKDETLTEKEKIGVEFEHSEFLEKMNVLLERIDTAVDTLAKSNNYIEIIEEITFEISKYEGKFAAIDRDWDVYNLEVDSHNSDVRRYNNSGFFGGAPIFDFKGESNIIENRKEMLDKRKRELEKIHTNTQSNAKRDMDKLRRIGNEIVEFISTEILKTILRYYNRVDEQIVKHDELVKSDYKLYNSLKKENETCMVAIERLRKYTR